MEKVHIGYSAVFSNNEPRVGVKKVDNDLLAMHLLVATVAVPSMRKEICVFSTPDDQKKKNIHLSKSSPLIFLPILHPSSGLHASNLVSLTLPSSPCLRHEIEARAVSVAATEFVCPSIRGGWWRRSSAANWKEEDLFQDI